MQSIDLQQVLPPEAQYRHRQKGYNLKRVVTEYQVPEIEQLFRRQVATEAPHQPLEDNFDPDDQITNDNKSIEIQIFIHYKMQYNYI